MTMLDLSNLGGGNDYRPEQRWDSWRLDPASYTLVLGDREQYSVDLEDCTTSAQVLDWIMQVADKTWATPGVIAGLVYAINDVLAPQSTLCGGGASMSLSQADIRHQVEAFAREYPAVVIAKSA